MDAPSSGELIEHSCCVAGEAPIVHRPPAMTVGTSTTTVGLLAEVAPSVQVIGVDIAL